jgi:hypothetical protein
LFVGQPTNSDRTARACGGGDASGMRSALFHPSMKPFRAFLDVYGLPSQGAAKYSLFQLGGSEKIT